MQNVFGPELIELMHTCHRVGLDKHDLRNRKLHTMSQTYCFTTKKGGLSWTRVFLAFFILVAIRIGAVTNDIQEINPPLGSFIQLNTNDFKFSKTFRTTDRLLVTPYFYWYDIYSKAHIVNPDGSDALTDHPPTLTGFSYRSSAWHKEQLRDMMAAGIDWVLPVYWGEPSQRLVGKPISAQPWSYSGILPLVQARDELLSEGATPPFIGLFYDTSTLQHNVANKQIDLATSYGRRWFYESIRDFYSIVPPKHWAMINNQPVVFLYSAGFATRHDQTCITYLRTNFAKDFANHQPFIVREISWNVTTEAVYAWGGALGLKNPGVASFGPGYDHSAVPGRAPLIVPRNSGGFFKQNWERFLSRPSNIAFIETWNEFHEGTDIANSKEYGKAYIELNRKYSDLFKSGSVFPQINSRYSGARSVEVILSSTNTETGLQQFEQDDGKSLSQQLGDSSCRTFVATSHPGTYLYFKVDDSFKWADIMNVSVIVEYYDGAVGTLRLQFDGSDPQAPFQGVYSSSPEVINLRGSKTWKTGVFSLKSARLRNLQNGGADFRLESSVSGVGIRKVTVLRPGLRADRFIPPEDFQLTLFAEPGRNYALESSRNFIDWIEFSRLPITNSTTPYQVKVTAGSSYQWYRARPR